MFSLTSTSAVNGYQGVIPVFITDAISVNERHLISLVEQQRFKFFGRVDNEARNRRHRSDRAVFVEFGHGDLDSFHN